MDLQATFTECGVIRDLAIILDQFGKSTGAARIVFESRESTLFAIQKYNGKLADGFVLRLSEVQVPQPDHAASTSGFSR